MALKESLFSTPLVASHVSYSEENKLFLRHPPPLLFQAQQLFEGFFIVHNVAKDFT